LEINSRECRLDELRSSREVVLDRCSERKQFHVSHYPADNAEVRDYIATKRDRIRRRRKVLDTARRQHEDALSNLTDLEDTVISEQ
jgi:hypothetical protein